MIGKRVDWNDGALMQPGNFTKLPDGAWYAETPNGYTANLAAHAVVEHEDGTITVSPSILVALAAVEDFAEKEVWHGFLERGVWRAV